eukprot:symbB.v1.2.013490.t1/scaffold957.1/size148979/8
MTGDRPLWLTTTQSADIGLIAKGDGMAEPPTRFVVQSSTTNTVLSGTFVFLKSMATGKIMEVDGADIRARSSMQGTRQRIFVGDAQMKVKVAVFKLAPMATAAFRAALAMDVKNSQGATQLLSEVSQHLERITVAVLGQEILTKSALETALLPILLGTWEEERAQRFCTVCWDAAFKAAQKTKPSTATTTATPAQGTAVAKAMEVMAEHHATELLQDEQRKEKRKTPKAKAKPPAAVPATVVLNNDAAVEDAEDFGSESSGEMKVRDQSNPFSVLSDVKDDSLTTGSGSRKTPGRDRCKWTVKSYKNGQETTWDVLETDGHLNNMRIVGKESVGVDASGPATRKTLLPAKGAESEKEGSRAKSAHSTLSYSETAEEEHSISMMRTVSSGTGQRLLEEINMEQFT